MSAAHVQARVEIVDKLPGGRAVALVEKAGEIRFLFRRGHLSPEGQRELVELMQYEIDSKTWEQHWDDPDEGPSQMRDAS